MEETRDAEEHSAGDQPSAPKDKSLVLGIDRPAPARARNKEENTDKSKWQQPTNFLAQRLNEQA